MIEARVASALDISAATELLTVAYTENPLITWYFPDTDRQDRTRELFRSLLERAVPHGSVYIDADVRGCAIWAEPTSEPVAARFPQAYVGDRRGQVLAAMTAAWPTEPHGYIAAIGVHPAQRRQGVASALVTAVLGRCDQLAVPVYLENSDPANDVFYQRHGFSAVNRISTGEGPPLVGMWRPRPRSVPPLASST